MQNLASTQGSPWWLSGGHLQTIIPAKLAQRPKVDYRRERWQTTPGGQADGDFIEVDWVDAQRADAPTLVLFHGFEGNAQSHYARAIMAYAARLGWRAAVPHFRGCSGVLNHAPRFYHSGDSLEIAWIVQRMHTHIRGLHPDNLLYAAGASLGGNALLKWLGEQGNRAVPIVSKAVAISAPIDLSVSGHALGLGLNRLIYTRMFLKSLKLKCLQKLRQFPGLFDRDAMLAARTIYEFDNVVTAPLHGFRDTNDYWQRAASKPVLSKIAVPTLILNARNDPFLPAYALPQAAEVSGSVRLDYPEQGGHVGFLANPKNCAVSLLSTGLYALPQRVFDFLSACDQFEDYR